jgi:multidrug resistance efflux pump
MESDRGISFVFRLFTVFLLILASVGILYALILTKPKVEVGSEGKSHPAVIVIAAKPIEISRRLIGYGTADAVHHADIPAQISSTVFVVPPTTRAGRLVKKGDLLVELDDSDFVQQVVQSEQALEIAKSELAILEIERYAADARATLAIENQALSEAELARVQDAFDRGGAKQREVDQKKQELITVMSEVVNANEVASRFPVREEQHASTVKSRIADLAIARKNLSRCKILSPIDGVIQHVDVRVSENVQKGTRVVRVVHSDSMEIPLRLASFARAHVSVGDIVSLRSAGFGKRHWEARVSRVAPEDETQTRTMVVFVDIEQDPNGSGRIPPGLFVRGEITSSRNVRERWVVPRRSIHDDRIVVVYDSVLQSIPVKIAYSVTGALSAFGLPDHDWAVLETALTLGDLLVVDPGTSLRDGMRVRPILADEVSFK